MGYEVGLSGRRQNADVADTLHQGTLPWQPLLPFDGL